LGSGIGPGLWAVSPTSSAIIKLNCLIPVKCVHSDKETLLLASISCAAEPPWSHSLTPPNTAACNWSTTPKNKLYCYKYKNKNVILSILVTVEWRRRLL
jgi:hypothetical protein